MKWKKAFAYAVVIAVGAGFISAIRCVRQLWAIYAQLQQIVAELEIDEEDAAESVQKAAESVVDSLEELGEEFADEDEDEDD